jgi:hypothetical protein
MHVIKVRVLIFQDLMSEVESSEISNQKGKTSISSSTVCLLENVEGFRFEKKIDDQGWIVFMNQSHHTRREKREASNRRATVLGETLI